MRKSEAGHFTEFIERLKNYPEMSSYDLNVSVKHILENTKVMFGSRGGLLYKGAQ